ncbi:MAG: Asp-tRNA(Asn)/Glu-tRNA(Gln) amidotransferase subunit GatA [Syntrophaceticus sp.]
MEIFDLTAHQLAEMMEKRTITAQEITEAVVARIRQVDGDTHAYLTVTEDNALVAAKAVDQRRRNGEKLPPLAGVPLGLKDNICTRGIRTTCASRMLENFIPPYSATVVEKLSECGAVITGKLNMDEFAMGSTTEFSAFFPTYNPWDLERVPGGSSGGPAAAVAAGEAIYALGSDTGGSVRQPASFCGIVGMKPTYGLVSRSGVVPFASSLDHVGVLTKDVRDCALVLNAIVGRDPRDNTTAAVDTPDYTTFLTGDIKGKRIGVPQEQLGDRLDPGIAEVFKKALEKLEELGAVVEECSFPHAASAVPAYHIIAPAEASSNLARFDGVRYGYRAAPEDGKEYDLLEMYMKTRGEGFGLEVKRRIMMGTYVLSSSCYEKYYLKALKVRTVIRNEYQRLFQDFDLLVTPTSPDLPFHLGEEVDDPLELYHSDSYTIPVNMAGLPAISLPCGFTQGLPVGMQLIAPAFADGDILQVAHAFEQNTAYYEQRPPLRGKRETAKGSGA